MAESKYKPIRAETSASNSGGLRYSIPNIPIGWKLDKTDGRYDFRVVAISEDGQIVENLSSAYLSFDESASTLTVAPVFGQKDFCVYVFRDEEAVNLFAIKSDGSASLASILAQFEKDNRVLAQLQALQGRSLRSPDECATLPDAEFRKNKFLGFDANGNPVCEIEMTAFADARAEVAQAKADAAKSADAAAKSAGAAATSAELASIHEGNTSEYASNALAAKDAAESAKAAAKASAESAAASDDNATSAAANAAESASSAQTSALNAETSATAAQSSATSAESSAQSAEVSAGIAAQQASDAESAKDAAVAAKNTATTQAGLAADSADNAAQSATTAQQAAAQAVEITDPEGWRTDTRAMIARLALTKSDSGTLYCNGGYAKVPQGAFTSLSKCSILLHFARNGAPTSEETLCALGDAAGGLAGFIAGIKPDPYFSMYSYFIKPDGTGSAGPYTSVRNIESYLDGKMHTLAICWSGTQIMVFIDGELKSSKDMDSGMTIKSTPAGISFGARALTNKEYFHGQVSDFTVLNFDVSATDAPYSLADYQAGKRLPPFLSSGVYVKSNPDVDTQFTPNTGKLGTTTQGTLAKSDSGYTLTLTSASTRRFWFKFDKKYPAGTWFRVRRGALTWDGMETTPTRISQASLNVGTSTTSPYTIAVSNLPTSEAVDVVFQTPIEANMVGFIVWNGADVATATVSIPYFEFEVLGATTALENYTFDGKIRDASGNENHATISGSVAGDMDNSVNQIYSAFSAKYTQENA